MRNVARYFLRLVVIIYFMLHIPNQGLGLLPHSIYKILPR